MFNDKWMHEGRIFRQKHIQNDKYKEKMEKVKCSKNINRHDALNDNEIQECNNDNTIVSALGENVLLQERNNDLKLEVENIMEIYEV